MITRSKLVEQLRVGEQRIRSRNKSPLLAFFSPKPHLTSWGDVGVAIVWALVISMLVIASYVTFGWRQSWVSPLSMFIGISLLLRLRVSRQTLARKKDTRLLLLPLSM